MDKKQSPAKYPRQELFAQAPAVFGVNPEVLAGALYGNNVAELSVDEAKDAIKKFLGKKVK